MSFTAPALQAGGRGRLPCEEESLSCGFEDYVLPGGRTPPLCLGIVVFMLTALLSEHSNELRSMFELRILGQAGP